MSVSLLGGLSLKEINVMSFLEIEICNHCELESVDLLILVIFYICFAEKYGFEQHEEN